MKSYINLAAVLALGLSACAAESGEESASSAQEAAPTAEVAAMDHGAMDHSEMSAVEQHDALMAEIITEPAHQIQSVGILVYNGVNDLDVMGPKYVLGQLTGAQTHLVAVEPGPVTTVMGTQLIPDTLMADVSELDILVVPGGFRGTIEAAYDEDVLAWIRQIDQSSTFTTAVCTGTWILGASGLLEGKQASSNWYRAEEYMTKYGAEYTGERYTQDGKYWTSAGVTAGMDMSLAIMNEIWGESYTQAVMLDMEYDPAPPIRGGTPERSEPAVFQMMEAMYDLGVEPIVDSLEALSGR